MQSYRMEIVMIAISQSTLYFNDSVYYQSKCSSWHQVRHDFQI